VPLRIDEINAGRASDNGRATLVKGSNLASLRRYGKIPLFDIVNGEMDRRRPSFATGVDTLVMASPVALDAVLRTLWLTLVGFF
jgi:hypothetical protein